MSQKGGVVLALLLFILTVLTVFGYFTVSQKPNPLSKPLLKSQAPIPTQTPNPPPQISIKDTFAYHDPQNLSKNPDKITIIATGDIIPARSVNTKVLEKNNFNYPFEKTADFLKSADAVFINLESPLIKNCPSTDGGMIFCGDTRHILGLKFAGVSVASIANNHAGNHGLEGVNGTVSLLQSKGIAVTGNGKPAIITVKGKKFAFLGYNDIGAKEPGISWADSEKIKSEIINLKKQADFVIVTFHWGIEYTPIPNQRQKELAHLSIDSGADLIIGNHPHWVQGLEKYKGKFITYAHGNYVFDQMWSQKTREGVLGRYTFGENGVEEIQFFPVIIEDFSRPRFADPKEAREILEGMKLSSTSISGREDF